MSLQYLQPQGLLSMDGISQVVIAEGRKAFIAGQASLDENFQIIGAGDYFAQTIQAYKNLAIALAAAGSSPEKVISTTCYIVNITPAATEEFFRAMNQVLDGKPFPPNAMTLIGVPQLAHPDLLVEISAIAAID